MADVPNPRTRTTSPTPPARDPAPHPAAPATDDPNPSVAGEEDPGAALDLPPALSISTLHRRPECVPTLRTWFVSEWPAWYGPGGIAGPGQIDDDLAAFARSEHELPVGLVVFEGTVLVGAAALKSTTIATHTHLGPWAAAGYVVPHRRGRGIGAFLLQGLVQHARKLGHPHVYCGTRTANNLLVRAGWELSETVTLDGQPLGLYRSAG